MRIGRMHATKPHALLGPVGDEMTRSTENLSKLGLDALIDQAPAAFFMKDRDGRYLYVNKQFEIDTGISSRDAVGRTDSDLFSTDEAAVYRRDDLRTLEEMSPLRFDEPVVTEGRQRLFCTLKFPLLRDEEVVGVCGISVDITEEQPEPAEAQRIRADAFFGRLLASLTPQEVRVLDLVALGLSDNEIAEKMSLSSGTVRHHVSHLLKKLRKRRAHVIIEMLKRGAP